MANLLRQLARDIREHFACECQDKEGNSAPPRCRCAGEGTDLYGNIPGPLRGCWHCQAKSALSQRARSPRGSVKRTAKGEQR